MFFFFLLLTVTILTPINTFVFSDSVFFSRSRFALRGGGEGSDDARTRTALVFNISTAE
jgi:hypothetical protein